MPYIEKNNCRKPVLIINPPLYFSNGIPHALDVSVPPLSILYLASYINKYSDDFIPMVIDVAVENITLKEIGERINKIKPFVIGISSMTPQLQGCVELAEFIKNNILDRPKIFLGGPHISADPDFINRFRNIFDYAITGEAEKTFLDSINNILHNRDIPRIQAGEVIMDLDSIPFPDKGLISRNKYSQYESMIFSRGCPYKCYYCSRPSISKKVRYRSVENLLGEIRYIYKFCDGKIDFQDDTFTIDKKRVLELCKGIIKENLKIEWRCNTRVDLVDEELLSAMKKAGCSLIHFGIESGNEKLRREVIKKGSFSNKQIEGVFKICKKLGIKIAAYFMIGHLGETEKELNDTRALILNSGIDLMGLSIPTPFPGSELYDRAKEKGIMNEQIIDQFARKEIGEGYTGVYPIFISEQLSKEYLFSVMKDINRRFYVNFKTFWKKIKEDITSFNKIKNDTKDFFSLLFRGISTRKPYVLGKGKK
ncbi:MAG: radical SAM protein [bacterium]